MIKPMLVKKVGKLPEGDNFIYEEKYDGGRIIAVIKDGRVNLYTRAGNDVKNQFPEVVEHFRRYKGNYTFDGEICVIRQGKCDFEAYLKRVHTQNPFQISILARKLPATYFVFDILEKNGEDLRYDILIERKRILRDVINDDGFIKYAIWHENPHFLLEKRHLIEGIVAKDRNSIYEEGRRGTAWVKYRFIKEAVVEAVDYEITPAGIVAITSDGNRITVNGRQAEAVMQAIEEDGRAKIEINYYEKSKDGRFRFPAFKRIQRKEMEVEI